MVSLLPRNQHLSKLSKFIAEGPTNNKEVAEAQVNEDDEKLEDDTQTTDVCYHTIQLTMSIYMLIIVH